MADMDLFDERIYRTLTIKGTSDNRNGLFIVPGVTQMTYAGSYYESPAAAIQSGIDKIEELSSEGIDDAIKSSIMSSAKGRAKAIIEANEKNAKFYNAPLSFIHPYALLRLNSAQTTNTDASGNINNVTTSGIIDKAGEQKWYEEDSTGLPDNSKNYAKNPTTADLISWSKSDPRGRFTYMFQDFVFCKYWNRIENNRMITLRRYPAPVVDAVEPADYNGADVLSHVDPTNADTWPTPTDNVFAPLATAITYFGEGTGNSLKELLGFAYQYNWDEMETDVWNTTSSQIEEGKILNENAQWLSGGLSVIAQATGIIRDLQGKEKIQSIHAVGLPPDPYSSGPYENRILGPVNVINNSYKRKRGLKFTHDSLTLTFEYMSRPIANVNNKAIMLDLLANILTMTYSSAVFFGGAHRYRTDHPAIYPWRNTNSLNKIYRGKLFGKESAWYDVLKDVFNRENGDWILDLANGITNAVKAVASDLIAAITGKTQSSEEKEQNENDKRRGKTIVNTVMGTAGRAVAAKFLKGKQAPWLQDARALLTGEPVGDWHLMIGNPLNPIAMIGNLIVTNSKIEFSDELGPDDFPIGFKAQITLQHAMGRDKDGIEAMFNRGAGRIYILPDDFVSSADGESTVDKYTGKNNPFEGTFKTNGEYGVLATTGSFYAKGSTTSLWSSKDRRTRTGTYTPTLSANTINTNGKNVFVINDFKTQAWQMHSTL